MLARLKRAKAYLVKRLAHVEGRIKKRRPRSTGFARAQRGVTAAKRIIKLHPPYRLGDGHSTPADVSHGGDCSSYWCELLQAMGVKIETTDTSGIANQLIKGPGKFVTLYVLTGRGGPEDHVIGTIFGKGTEMGGRDNPFDDGRPAWVNFTTERIHEFAIVCHPPGL